MRLSTLILNRLVSWCIALSALVYLVFGLPVAKFATAFYACRPILRDTCNRHNLSCGRNVSNEYIRLPGLTPKSVLSTGPGTPETQARTEPSPSGHDPPYFIHVGFLSVS